MLKIYLQVFGTVAICLIILLNYQVFVQKPNKEKMKELNKELITLVAQAKVLDQILEYEKEFDRIEQVQFADYETVHVFFAESFNEPRFMGRITKLIELSGCETDGIIVGKTTTVLKPITYDEFVTKPKDNLETSIKSFLSTMGKYTDQPAKWQQIVGPNAVYATRLPFYMDIREGKKFPATMLKSMEVHRFNMTINGNYTSCKRFLQYIDHNRPFTQATISTFQPVTDELGPDKQFTLRCVVSTYVDVSERMKSSAEIAAKPKEAKPEKAQPEAAAEETEVKS